MTQAYRWRVAAVVAIGLFMAILDTTIGSVTLPQTQMGVLHTASEKQDASVEDANFSSISLTAAWRALSTISRQG